MKNFSDFKLYVALHIMLMIYSLSGVFSKLASKQNFMSLKFCLFYIIVIFLLFLYAIGWQQIIKKMPLTTAFANKAITVVWGIVWGGLFFCEKITIGKLIGAVFVIIGVILFARSAEEENE